MKLRVLSRWAVVLTVLPAGAQDAGSYRLSVPVDEVTVTFHATDAHGMPVDDLRAAELRVFDNDRTPGRIVSFEHVADRPVRVGILIDTSDSMTQQTSSGRAIAAAFLRGYLRPGFDSAFAAEFNGGVTPVVAGDLRALATAIEQPRYSVRSHLRGTAMFDAVSRSCLYQFGQQQFVSTGRMLLLFTDGEDNASQSTLRDAVELCQRANVAVYAFRARSANGSSSTGVGDLLQLSDETGGHVFREEETDADVAENLRRMAEEQRSEYRMVYRARELKHDGAFHSVVVLGPERVAHMAARSGYYAPGS